MVCVRLRDYCQKTIVARDTKKLSKRYFGPFKVIERIGKVGYRLQLPPEAKIHPVFHVSLLRQAYGNPIPTPLPQWDEPGDTTIPTLEDELVAKPGTFDTSPEHNSPIADHQKPKRIIRRPARFQD